jgi:2-hydroxyglutarate dehydrogenase
MSRDPRRRFAAVSGAEPHALQAQSTDPPKSCDIAVVGGGIVGLAVARELARRHDGAAIAVLEREAGIARHQTGHTSGVIHAGIYYEPGSLKARLCVEGARDLYAYCDARGIPARRDGKLIVASSPDELPRLDELERRGHANGVEGLRRLRGDEIATVEPHAAGIAALHSPATGVVDFVRVAESFAQDLAACGGSLVLGCEVAAIRERDGEAVVVHGRGEIAARAVVSCAGAWSDRLAVAAGAPAEPRLVSFRGSYLRLRPERADLVRASIYPVPDPALPFLGVHLTRGPDGAVLLGPTALMTGVRAALAWPGTWRMGARHWRAGIREIRHAAFPGALVHEARRLVPELRRGDFSAGPAGVRGQAVARDGSLVDDFVVSRSAHCVHVRNAPSPAATAALALARAIADEVEPV